jgi:hypothetical protein
MTSKEIARLVKHIEPQGVKFTRTKKGLLLRLPDDTTTMIHFTSSDHASTDAIRARLRRAGVSWPTDSAAVKLPPYLGTGSASKTTLERMSGVLDDLGNPLKLKTADAMRIWKSKGYPTDYASVMRGLYNSGYTPTQKTPRGQIAWEREDEEAVTAIVEEIEHPEPIEPPALALVPEPEPEPEPTKPAGREFIDTADSWTVDLETIDRDLTLRQILGLYGSTGLTLELRVWRHDENH